MQERLNQIFEQKGLTAAKFATLIGVSASTISHILAGRNKPGFDIINSIAKEFPDISLSWLITGEGSMYNQFPLNNVEKEQKPEETLFDSQLENEILRMENTSQKKTETSASHENNSLELPPVSSIKNEKPRKIKRIVFFFDDGSFEDYQNDVQ